MCLHVRVPHGIGLGLRLVLDLRSGWIATTWIGTCSFLRATSSMPSASSCVICLAEDCACPEASAAKKALVCALLRCTDTHIVRNARALCSNHKTILSNAKLEPPDEVKYGKGAPWEAPELAHMSYIDMFIKLAQAASRYGILVLMACHRLDPDAWPGTAPLGILAECFPPRNIPSHLRPTQATGYGTTKKSARLG
jgi:hypothetical protein